MTLRIYRLRATISAVWFSIGVLPAGGAVPAPVANEEEVGPATVVQSDILELESGPMLNKFYFRENVRVSGNNIIVTCDSLEVVANRGSGETGAVIGELGSIETIVAYGNVHITQAGRHAYAGKAEVFPREERVVLSQAPKIVDDGAEVTGWRIILLKGERRAVVESDPASGNQRPTVTLDALPDLGYDMPGGAGAGGGSSHARDAIAPENGLQEMVGED